MLATGLVAVILVLFVYTRIQTINSLASDKLDMARKIISSGDMEHGLSAIDDVINTYKNSPAVYRAMLVKASYFINQKKYEDAEHILKVYITTAKPEIVRPIGYPLLINLYDDKNKNIRIIIWFLPLWKIWQDYMNLLIKKKKPDKFIKILLKSFLKLSMQIEQVKN